jgi:DNA-binding Lrp family transcriptional regulator
VALGFVLVATQPGTEREVFRRIAAAPGVVELVPLEGEYAMIAKVEAEDFDAMGRLILQGIRPVPGVASTKTLPGANL